MSLNGKKVAVLIENIYEDMEVWVPVYRVKEQGATVTLIGPKKETYLSKHDYPAQADLSITEAHSSNFDVVIIPGGFAPDHRRAFRGAHPTWKTLGQRKVPFVTL